MREREGGREGGEREREREREGAVWGESEVSKEEKLHIFTIQKAYHMLCWHSNNEKERES